MQGLKRFSRMLPWTLVPLAVLTTILGIFRMAIIGYLGSSLVWWIVTGMVVGLLLLQTVLLVKQRGGGQRSLLGWLFGVIGMLGLAVLAAIFFTLAWPGVLIALIAGTWARLIERAEQPSESAPQTAAQRGMELKAE